MNTTVTISECKTTGRTWTSTHRTADKDEAISRAIEKHFGAKYSLYRDNGQPNTPRTVYGQIGYYLPKANASTMSTGRVRVDIEQ